MLIDITNRGHLVTLGFEPVTKHWQLMMSKKRGETGVHIFKGTVLKEVVREGLYAAS